MYVRLHMFWSTTATCGVCSWLRGFMPIYVSVASFITYTSSTRYLAAPGVCSTSNRVRRDKFKTRLHVSGSRAGSAVLYRSRECVRKLPCAFHIDMLPALLMAPLCERLVKRLTRGRRGSYLAHSTSCSFVLFLLPMPPILCTWSTSTHPQQTHLINGLCAD